jgi:uncharacterized tellurite resistance protein B-like protein
MIQDSQLRLRRVNFFKLYCWFAALALLYVWIAASGPAAFVFLLFVIAGGVAVDRWDSERRTVRLIYDVDSDEVVERLGMANGAAQWLGHCQALWHVFRAVQTSDWKKNAGASTLIRRTTTRCRVGALPHFELNVEVWCVPVGPQQLLFLPDRLLVWDGAQLAALPYETLSASASAARFIEDGGRPPSDAEQVDTTWRFVRRDGGPDLRFANNAQLPVMRYGELELASGSGLRIILQTSTVDSAEGAARALAALARKAVGEPRGTERRPMAADVAPASRVVPVQPRGAPPEDPALELTRSVATLLKYLAAADRRVDSPEVALAERVLSQLLPAGHPETARLGANFRSLPTDSDSVRMALNNVSAAGPEYRLWVANTLAEMANADGKVTPKEVERLSEVRQALGL